MYIFQSLHIIVNIIIIGMNAIVLGNRDSKSLMNFLCVFIVLKRKEHGSRGKKRSHFRSNKIMLLHCNHPQNSFFFFPTVSQKSMKSKFGTYYILLFLVAETKLLISGHCKCSKTFEQRNIFIFCISCEWSIAREREIKKIASKKIEFLEFIAD